VIDQDVYVPFTFAQCVQFLVASHPAEETHFVVAHPEFTPFWMAIGEHVVFHPECRSDTGQGVTVVVDQGLWPNQCAWCLKPFAECLGCVFPSYVPGVAPSQSLPRELGITGPAFDDWKVQFEVGMAVRQSFSFVLDASRCPTCWKAKVGEVDVFVIFALDWCQWLEPQRGLELTVFDALLAGIWGDTKVFLVEKEDRSFPARKWKNEGLRFLELFAGIGGWSAALPFMVQNAAVVAIEIDPERAVRLAKMRACPAVPLDFLTADLATQEVVIIGDIRDKRWLKISLAWPFRGVLHSPPCTSFSGGGNALGLQAEDGQLMLHSLGCLAALQPEFSIGENVKGLLKHPHWHLIHRFAEMLGLKHLRVKLLDLEQVMPMRRPRCFFCFFARPMDFSILGATKLRIPEGLWTVAERYEVGLTPEEEAMLSNWDFLSPFDKRLCSRNPAEVLARRTYTNAPLPVLMAAYKHQIRLPLSSLIEKGLYTWIVKFGTVRRYLHAFEAARLLGFGPMFSFTVDGDADLTVLGNSVSPIQVLQVLRPVLRNLGLVDTFPAVELRELVALMVCGWPFLRNLSIRPFVTTLKFGVAEVFELPQNGQILVVYQSHTWWLSHHRLIKQGIDIQDALTKIIGIGKGVCIRKCTLLEDIIEVHVEFEPVTLFGYNFSFGASPLSTWGQLLGTLAVGFERNTFAKVHLESQNLLGSPDRSQRT
jgi:site-specific DNA-cytosine methylase